MTAAKLFLINNRQLRENSRAYGIGLLAILGILSFLFMIVWHWRDSFGGDAHRGIFLIGLFGGGCLFAASLLKDLSQPSKGMWFLGIPASVGEKVFIAVIYASFFYMVIYIVIYYVTQGFFLWLITPKGLPIEPLDLLQNDFYNFAFTFVTFQLLILLGCLTFKRGALLKTILLMIVFFSLSNYANNLLLAFMTGEKGIDGGGLYNYFQFRHDGENVYIYIPAKIQTIVTIYFQYLLPISLYYIIYLKFRETER